MRHVIEAFILLLKTYVSSLQPIYNSSKESFGAFTTANTAKVESSRKDSERLVAFDSAYSAPREGKFNPVKTSLDIGLVNRNLPVNRATYLVCKSYRFLHVLPVTNLLA